MSKRNRNYDNSSSVVEENINVFVEDDNIVPAIEEIIPEEEVSTETVEEAESTNEILEEAVTEVNKKIEIQNTIRDLEHKLKMSNSNMEKASLADKIRLEKEKIKKLDEKILEKEFVPIKGAKSRSEHENTKIRSRASGSNITVDI